MAGRKFSHQKFFILLLLTLKLDIPSYQSFQQHFQYDINYCPDCFRQQIAKCSQFLDTLTYSNDAKFHNFINSLAIGERRRRAMLLDQKTTQMKIVSKNLAKGEQLERMKNLGVKTIMESLHDEERLDGLQFCPPSTIGKLINLLQANHNSKADVGNETETIALYLLFGTEPVLLPYLHANLFPVPRTLATCGFTTFQEFAGKPLHYFYGNGDFKLKLSMASQLLEAALKFSHGIDGFRMYITDLNADNIVYNQNDRTIYLVDLDTLYVVDSTAVKRPKSVHRHSYIECNDCFAYDPSDICASGLSDINLFTVCQLLRENLKQDRTGGFLYPIPSDFGGNETTNKLQQMLDECVDCALPGCLNRFAVANRLITFIKSLTTAT